MTTTSRFSKYPAHCGECCEPIDLAELSVQAKAGLGYVHHCGRQLVRPRND